MRDVAEAVKPPRVLLLNFPFGSSVGRPNDKAGQTEVVRAMLRVLEEAREPGTIVEGGFAYGAG